MEFPFGQTVYRDRRPITAEPDPYNPGGFLRGDWDEDLTIEIEDAFVASSSSNPVSDATRSQILTTKSLYLTDPDADVVAGDRIRTEAIPFVGGNPYYVNARPEADTNPFTGWQPIVEIPLDLVEG